MFEKIKYKIGFWLIEGVAKDGIRRKIVEWLIYKEGGTMLEGIRAKLQGKKTYVLGIGSIITLVMAWVNGTVQTPELLNGTITAILAMTVRAGVSTETTK